MSNVLRCLLLLPVMFCLSGCGWINNWFGDDDNEDGAAEEIQLAPGSIVYKRPAEFQKPNQAAAAISWEYDSSQSDRPIRLQITCTLASGAATWDEGEQALTCAVPQWIATNKLVEINATDGARRVEDGRVDNQTQLVGTGLQIRGVNLTRTKLNTSTGAGWAEVELDDDGRPENQ
jgi:hypothetical protein